MKRRKCISCNSLIFKSARVNPYLCRECENGMETMDLVIPEYHGKFNE